MNNEHNWRSRKLEHINKGIIKPKESMILKLVRTGEFKQKHKEWMEKRENGEMI